MSKVISYIGKNSLSGQVKSLQSRKVSAVEPSVNPEQSRAARGWLGWSQTELAQRAGVATTTVHGFESGQRKLTRNNMAALRQAIEAEGIRLLFDEGGVGVGIVRQNASIEIVVQAEQRASRDRRSE